MKYIKYFRRENSVYYPHRNKAVASHSRRWVRDPNGLSSHLKTEKSMSADERKRFRLPCRYTIAQSWAALRKCWLGFYITKNQGDKNGMVEYAYRIRKIQAQMAIEPTNFDSDILDENTVKRIDALYRKTSKLSNEKDNDWVSDADSDGMDYPLIFGMDGSENSRENMPVPRQDIFKRTEKSCPSPAYQTNVQVDVHVTDYDKSCYRGPPKKPYQSKIDIQRIKRIYKKQCRSPPTNENNFAISSPENTLAVPNPNQPPIEPIIRGGSCAYHPVEGPPHEIHKDRSCEYDPQVNPTQSSKREKVIQRKSKSCSYTGQI